MSDAGVLRAIEEMEEALRDAVPEETWITAWQVRLDGEKATAERGPEWAGIAERGHALARILDERVQVLRADQARLKLEMNTQARGMRALQGYGGSTR